MEAVFYTLCAFFPIHLLAYLPFLDTLRFGKKTVVVTVICNMLLHLSGVGWVVHIGRPDLAGAVGYVMVPISLGLYFLNINLPPSKLIFTYAFLVNYNTIILGIANYLSVVLFHFGVRSFTGGILCLALFGITGPLMYRLFRYAAQQVYRIQAPELWRIIWLLPTMTCAIVLIFTGKLTEASVNDWRFLIARTGLLLCVVVIYWVLLRSMEGIQKQAALQEQLAFETYLLDIQVAEQKKHNQLMLESAQQLRRQRHDLRHQLTTIQQLAGAENQALTDYISSLIRNIPAEVQNYCGNAAVNAIVSHYDALCRQNGIELTLHLQVPEQTEQISDSSLCVIFGNLLENAVEACGRMTEGKRFIRLNSRLHNDTLAITMENSFNGETRSEGGKFRSSKRDDFGIGLSSIQAVARENQGDAWFSTEGTVFYSSAYVRV